MAETEIAPVPGWVNTYYRHYKGKKLGPYYVRRWKVGGRTFRQYIKPQDAEKVKAQCQLNREMQQDFNEAYRRRMRFIGNADFFLRTLLRERKRKRIHPVHAEFFQRLKSGGMYIYGRPALRRKVTRQIAEVDGEKVVRKTVFELDGTTKTFMVPLSTKGAKCLSGRTYGDLLDLLLHHLSDASTRQRA